MVIIIFNNYLIHKGLVVQYSVVDYKIIQYSD